MNFKKYRLFICALTCFMLIAFCTIGASAEDETPIVPIDPPDVVSISLKFGGVDTIKNCDFEKNFALRVKDVFGIDVEVRFTGQLEDVKMVTPKIEQKPFIPQKSSDSAPKAAGGVKLSGLTVFEGANIDLETAEQVFGRKISGHITPLSEINPENDINLVS